MNIRFSVILLFSASVAFAQEPAKMGKNIAKVGFSGTFLGSGDLYGLSVFNEYERRLINTFSYTARLGATSASHAETMLGGFKAFQTTEALFFEHDVKVRILRGRFSILPHAGLGGRYAREDYTGGGVQLDLASNRYIADLETIREKTYSFGYGFGLNFAFSVSDKMVLEMVNSFDGYTNGDTVVMNGFSLGFAF